MSRVSCESWLVAYWEDERKNRVSLHHLILLTHTSLFKRRILQFAPVKTTALSNRRDSTYQIFKYSVGLWKNSAVLGFFKSMTEKSWTKLWSPAKIVEVCCGWAGYYNKACGSFDLTAGMSGQRPFCFNAKKFRFVVEKVTIKVYNHT